MCLLEKSYYRSTRKKGEELYFSVEIYTDQPLDATNTDKNITFKAKITYGPLKRGNTIIYQPDQKSTWWLVCDTLNKSCSFQSSILINGPYRSYGIGTLVINKLLAQAVKHFPKYRLLGRLSAIDEEDENNRTRRNRLYENLGFDIGATTFSIDHIEDLSIKDSNSINDINEVDPLNVFHDLLRSNDDLTNNIKDKERHIEDLQTIIEQYREKNDKKFYNFVKVSLLCFIIFLFFCFLWHANN